MGYKQYCKDYENIENYEKAKADNFKGWEVHHRLETHTPDGKRRDVDVSHKELKALGMYYHRPAEELIFLTKREHNALRKVSAETRQKLGEAKKGEKNPNYGKHFSEETKKKMAESHKGKNTWSKGKHHTEETKKKIAEASKGNKNVRGKCWYNNGKINTRAKECPDGFVPGMLK